MAANRSTTNSPRRRCASETTSTARHPPSGASPPTGPPSQGSTGSLAPRPGRGGHCGLPAPPARPRTPCRMVSGPTSRGMAGSRSERTVAGTRWSKRAARRQPRWRLRARCRSKAAIGCGERTGTEPGRARLGASWETNANAASGDKPPLPGTSPTTRDLQATPPPSTTSTLSQHQPHRFYQQYQQYQHTRPERNRAEWAHVQTQRGRGRRALDSQQADACISHRLAGLHGTV